MEELPATGRAKAIGVSNYSKPYLEALLAEAKIVPAVNQIEQHPSLPQDEIVTLAKEKGIHIMGYSPLGSTGSPLLTAEPVVKIAEKRGVSPGTVLLSWNSTLSLVFLMPVVHGRVGRWLADYVCSNPWQHGAGQVGHAGAHHLQQGGDRAGRRGHEAAGRLL